MIRESFTKTAAGKRVLPLPAFADQLGHAQISMTQDVYMGRKVVHSEVDDVLDRVIT
ncbi:hypothetical protein [Paenarthrobacter sp. Z7-10]|uniref:hypothetical protein n=1 Tax=Paenarthrobacter sp. Z7-10 TaxID=2787635 RepID=UPI0022A9AD5F|nr:hypothetical protein [Paenarthrobacter sp. Z7-10]